MAYTATLPAKTERPSFFERHWRWFFLATLFLATFLNYFDRQTLSNAADPICREFGLDNRQRGQLLARFVYFYAAAHLIVGPLVDRVRNFRWIFPVFVVGWSACNLLVAFAHDYATLLWLRAALGTFEAGNFPICLLLIARIFPPRERVLANGIFYSGGVIATLLAPKFVIYFATEHGWRWAFLVTGGLGLIWLIPWLAIFRCSDERTLAGSKADHGSLQSLETLGTIFRRPAFWGVVFVGMGVIPGLYFITQWLPSYLTQAWRIPYDQALGNHLVIVSFCQDLGMWVGGGVVMALNRGGRSLLGARRAVVLACYCCMMSLVLLPRVSSINVAIAILCIYVFGLGGWLANQQAFKQDISRGRVATVVGFVGFGETMLSAILVEHVGTVTERTGAFGAVFGSLAGLFTLAALVALIFMRERWLPQS